MTWRALGPLAAAVAIVAIVVVLLAPSNGRSIDPVASAADTTAAAGSAAFTLTGSIGNTGQTLPLTGNGAIDMRHQNARMSVSVPIPNVGNTQIDEIVNGTVFYIHLPSTIASRLPFGKSWIKLDLQALKKSTGIDFGKELQASESNPADLLQALKGVGNSRVVGRDVIGTVPTTHYSATIDLNKAVARIRDTQTVAGLKRLYAANGIRTLPLDVWIDGVGRVRRESLQMTIQSVSVNMTITFTQFGVPVDTTPPASDQVIDMSSVLGTAGAEIRSGG